MDQTPAGSGDGFFEALAAGSQAGLLDASFCRALLEALPDGVVLIDAQGQLVFSSPRMNELLGRAADGDIQGKSPFSEMLPADAERARRNIARMKAGGATAGEAYAFRRADGSIFYGEIRSTPLFHPDGSFRGLVSIIRDVTARREAESTLLAQNEALRQLNEQLRRQNEQLDEFSHTVSHDLRGPVGNLNLLLDLYQHGQDPHKRKGMLDMALKVAANLRHTLDDLVEVVRLGHLEQLEAPQILIEEVFTRIRQSLSEQLRVSGAAIDADFSAAPLVSYPEVYLESLLSNLTSNAVKFASAERSLRLQLRSEPGSDGGTLLHFADNGLGLDLNRFGPDLFRFSKIFHPGRSGKGMGLYLIKRQLERSGGRIEAESAPEQGMRYTVYFPPAKTEPSPPSAQA